MKYLLVLAVGLAAAVWCPQLAAQLPEAPGKAVVGKVCGTCHAPELVVGRAMNRDQWSAEVADMVTKGAKGTPEEFTQVVNYLATNFPANAMPGPAPGGAARPRGGGLTQGPDDKQIVDRASAQRGQSVYVADCVTCHGSKARGANENASENEKGPDLVRSVTLLHDRYGSTLGPFLKKGHPMQSGKPSASLTQAKVVDLSHFLHQRINDTLRGGPYSEVINVLTGNPQAGQAYFNGTGKCNTCHSPTGDLAGIAKRYDAAAMQQKFVFPRTMSFRRGQISSSKPVTVTVTTPSGQSVSGVLLHLDDFDVSLRDDSGSYHSWKRTADLKVVKHDPYAAHIDLLDQYSDKNIHDLTAYLETLK